MSFKEENKKFNQAVALAKKYINHTDVNDIFWGTKYVKGNPTDNTVIRFNVNKKKAKSKVKAHEMLPKRIGKFATDVTEFKPKKHLINVDPSSLIRPLIGGLQIQSSLFTGPTAWGTLGCVIRIKGINYGITNFHVAFGELPPGTDPNRRERILQPRFRDFGEPIGLTTVYNQLLDYTLVRVGPRNTEGQSVNGYEGEIVGYINPLRDMPVFKFGAATGKTFGIFDARSLIERHRVIIRYDRNAPNDGPRLSAPGDSGSMWLTREPGHSERLRILGLHYGGDQEHNIAFASLFSSISVSINNQIP